MINRLPEHLGRGLGLALVVLLSAECGIQKGPEVRPATTGGRAVATGGHVGSGPVGSGGAESGGVGSGGASGDVGTASGGVFGAWYGSTGGQTPGASAACVAGAEPAVPAVTTTTVSSPAFSGMGSAAVPPPPVSGGTLIVLRDGVTAVAADPDRDLIHVVNLANLGDPQVRPSIALEPRDEPGRLVEDGAGLVHVALRNAGAVVTIDPIAGTVTRRRSVCAEPRGLAYDATTDRLHVACSGGELVTLTPTGTLPERTLNLGSDLRDVVVDGARLMVTRFRSAEVLIVGGDGVVAERIRPPTLFGAAVRTGTPFEAAVAWRAVGMPGGGAAMVHQRGMRGMVDRRRGGYGGPSCDGIVHAAVSVVKAGSEPQAGPALPGFVLPVDVALSGDGRTVAVVAAGNGAAAAQRRLFVAAVDDVTLAWGGGCGIDGKHGPAGGSCATAASGSMIGLGCNDLPTGTQPTAVAFVGTGAVLVQSREPAQLWIVRRAEAGQTQVLAPAAVPLSWQTRADVGHAVFHANSGAGLACASCHPEGHEDGRTWDFQCQGLRRTQDVGGGLGGTEPFHWNGDQRNFAALVDTVFVGRMAGPVLPAEQIGATLRWLHSVPARPALRAVGDPRVARGRAIFQDPATGCASCHTGPELTNNTTVNVGTNGQFQVPSLRGVGRRAPYMHDGCAPDLAARLDPGTCGGGDAHGRTSHLSRAQIFDLVGFLESL